MGIRHAFAMAFAWLLLAAVAQAQQPEIFLPGESVSLAEGWAGFANVEFLLGALLTLTLATVLGGVLGFHPIHLRAADTLQEVELPKVYILCSLIGALIGILVVNYGLVVGFVIFGIGGLIRFRTVLNSPDTTGNVIFVTLIGLSCGLNLPHVAVLATAFSFGLTYLMDSRATYQVDIRGLKKEHVTEAAVAYRKVLEENGCFVMNERKNPNRGRVRLIFRTPRSMTRERCEQLIDTNIDSNYKSSLDWEVI